MSLRFLPLFVTLLSAVAFAAEPEGGDGASPAKKKDDRFPTGGGAKEEPANAAKHFTVAPGLKIDLWASEPLIQDVVAFSFDNYGRAYVAQTGRRRTSVPDIRKRMEWLLPDLALRSVEERIDFLKKVEAPEFQHKADKEHVDNNNDGQYDWRDMAIESESIRLVEDRDRDGVADYASTFADGFNKMETGVGAGVLASGGNVYYTCLPDLWKFTAPALGANAPAANADTLVSGFGVHVAYGGHDMHGVKMGPDGRIYWTVADCGARVTTKEGKVIEAQDFGGVYRCEPDGSKVELVAYGLRNPQSLAFNDVGDLFTGDNNADGGDRARWEHIVEGADYGWRIGWQFLPKLGLWNTEQLWHLEAGKTAYSQLPPVALIGHGPAGIAYYPGTGLPKNYDGNFFYADFPGGVRSFALKPRGASYTAENPNDILGSNKQAEMTNKLVWGLYPSDVQFGVDGGVYVLDWVEGWEKTGKGRIFRVHDAAVDASAEVKETKALLAQDFAKKPDADLASLLGHVDIRVRQAAQFALVVRGDAGLATLTRVAKENANRNARLHAIWGLGQIARKNAQACAPLAALLRDGDSEVRAQAAKCAAEGVEKPPTTSLISLLQDPESRVRFFAAQALGKIKSGEAVGPLLELAKANADADPYIRHAVVASLAALNDAPALTVSARDGSDSVRGAVLLALRRMHRPEVAVFLTDRNPQLALEAARAIHDEPIEAALEQLATTQIANATAGVARRIVNANFRVGNENAAQTLTTIASGPSPAPVRVDAIEALAEWNEPLGRDRLLGLARPALPSRDAEAATRVAKTVVTKLLVDPSREVRLATLDWIKSSKIAEAESGLLDLLRDAKAEPALRAGALSALGAIGSLKLDESLALASASGDPALIAEANRLAAKLSPAEALAQASATLENGKPAEQQAALQMLGSLKEKNAGKAISKALDRLLAGKLPAALQLDLLEAAAAQEDERDVQMKLASFEKTRKADDPLSRFAECLEGGDAAQGRTIFYEKAEAACLRCHKVKGEGGDVGPDLAGIASKHDRNYILTSIVSPNAEIAQGYENVLLTLKDGNMVVGIASAETADDYTITPLTGGAKQTVKKATVAKRDKVPSAMPEGLGEVLSKRELRNVIEFLATLK